ncbi:hypothetical protein K502DRAFT_325764 [Neoconidiobolus thromboides FSU 785]|nr:hypothetical protein K502DRAFT_325764 [Neoconidiobolus thromboides FSU 785]
MKKTAFNLLDFPNEILTMILLNLDITSYNSLLKLNHPRLSCLIHTTISKRFQNSQINIKVYQEEHWFMDSIFNYTGYDKNLNQLTFQCKNGSGIKLYRFFYALLVSKPIANTIHFKINNKLYQIVLYQPIRLKTKQTGIKVSRPLDSHCSLLYTVEDNQIIEEERNNELDSPGIRWVTPLSFHCDLDLFENIKLIKEDTTNQTRVNNGFISLFKRTIFDIKQLLNLNPIAAPTPTMLSPRHSVNIKQTRSPDSRPPIFSI